MGASRGERRRVRSERGQQGDSTRLPAPVLRQHSAARKWRRLTPVQSDEALAEHAKRQRKAAVRRRGFLDAELGEREYQRILVARGEQAFVENPLKLIEEI